MHSAPESLVTKAIVHNPENLLTKGSDDPGAIQIEEITNLYRCDLCTEEFTDNENLSCNIKSNHTQEGSNKCNQCEESFATEENLNVHRVAKHAQDLSIQCEDCTEILKEKKT